MKFEFITSFSSTVKALVDEEKDKYLALASLVDVGNFVPNVDTEANIDLLPVAFNACVVNRVNRNGDVIDSETAVAMACGSKKFLKSVTKVQCQQVNLVILTAFNRVG